MNCPMPKTSPTNIFKGNSFTSCTINGTPMCDSVPVHFGDGNVAFPETWSEERRREWRKATNVPGAEWEPEPLPSS